MTPSELATIEWERAERATVALVGGEVDLSNADRLLEELMVRVGEDPWLVIDLSGCSYLDSAGLRTIARLDVRCREIGARLRLVVDPDGSVDRVLSMTRMSAVLTVDRRLSDALASVLADVDGARSVAAPGNGSASHRGEGP